MSTPYIPGGIEFSFSHTGVYVTGSDTGKVDPWVVVGTTTIDGTYAQVNAMFGVDAVGKTTSLGPTLVGGRMLQPTGWHLNKDLQGCALVFCDIVRRQSEIDAEKAKQRADIPEVLRRLRASGYNISDPAPCPECGPHGNRGEVLLASSWAKCTTCAGGKPGDPEMRGAELDNLRHYLEGDRIVDKWGRAGTVISHPGKSWPSTSIRAQMDEGWVGIFRGSEILGEAGY